jgi:hypothetical protein
MWLASTATDTPPPFPGPVTNFAALLVFEGPYSQAREWYEAMRWTARAQGFEPGKVYFFYTTCPKCAEAYGKSYVVGVVEVRRAAD